MGVTDMIMGGGGSVATAQWGQRGLCLILRWPTEASLNISLFSINDKWINSIAKLEEPGNHWLRFSFVSVLQQSHLDNTGVGSGWGWNLGINSRGGTWWVSTVVLRPVVVAAAWPYSTDSPFRSFSQERSSPMSLWRKGCEWHRGERHGCCTGSVW
jgi:hypothetical protein